MSKTNCNDYKDVILTPGFEPMIAITNDDDLPEWAKPWAAAGKAKGAAQQPKPKKLSLATVERHRQIINKMEREKFITPAKAKALRQELRAQL
jgi:hypothetical protein